MARLVALFRSEGSRQILNLPFGLSTITIELTNSEDSEIGTSSVMSSRFILSSSCLNFSFNAIGVRRGAWITGSASDLSWILYSCFSNPMSSKKSAYSV